MEFKVEGRAYYGLKLINNPITQIPPLVWDGIEEVIDRASLSR